MVFRTTTKTGWTIITRGATGDTDRSLAGWAGGGGGGAKAAAVAPPSLLPDQIGDRLCRLGGAETTVQLDGALARRARAAGITTRFQGRAQVALDLGQRV